MLLSSIGQSDANSAHRPCGTRRKINALQVARGLHYQSCHAQPTARRSIRASGAFEQPRLRHSRRVDPGTGDRQHHHGVLVDRLGDSASLSRHHPERGTGRLGDGHEGSAQRRHRRLLARLPRLPRSLDGTLRAGDTPAVRLHPRRWAAGAPDVGRIGLRQLFRRDGGQAVAWQSLHAGRVRRQPGRVSRSGDQRPPVAQLLPLRSQDRGEDHAGQPALADDRWSGAGRVPRHFAGDAVRFLGARHDGGDSRIAAGVCL